MSAWRGTRNETLAAAEVTTVDGIPVTSAARTAFDLGRRPGSTVAVIRIDALARATGLVAEDVWPLVDAHRGARGMKQLRRVLPLVDAGAESPQETRTRLALLRGGAAQAANTDRRAQRLGRRAGPDRHGLGGVARRGGVRRAATLDGPAHPRQRHRTHRGTGTTRMALGPCRRRPAATPTGRRRGAGTQRPGGAGLPMLTARLQPATRFSRRPVAGCSLAKG